MNETFVLDLREIRTIQSVFHKPGDTQFVYRFKRDNTGLAHEHSFGEFSLSFCEDQNWKLGHKFKISIEV